MVVLAGAGLLLRTLDKLHSIDPGFDTRNILLFSINPELAGYNKKQISDLYKNLQRRLAALPGVDEYQLLVGRPARWEAYGLKMCGLKGRRIRTRLSRRCCPSVRITSRR